MHSVRSSLAHPTCRRVRVPRQSDFHPFSSKGGGRGKAKQSSREDEDDEDEGPVVSEGVRRESMEKGNGGNQEGTPPTERTKDDEKK